MCSKLDLFAWAAFSGSFVGVRAGSQTWVWCYIINMTCDWICRTQPSPATPQKFVSILLTGKTHPLAQANREFIFLEKCGNDSDAEHRANFSLRAPFWPRGHGTLRVVNPNLNKLPPNLLNIMFFTLSTGFLIRDPFKAIIYKNFVNSSSQDFSVTIKHMLGKVTGTWKSCSLT